MSLLHVFERYLGACAQKTIQREHPFIIAITGSVGKSSTRACIELVLDAKNLENKTRCSIKNYNNELGIPLTIFGLQAPGRSLLRWMYILGVATCCRWGWMRTGIETYILEMGADRPGDLAKLVTIAPPDIAIVTAVTPEDTSIAPVHAANYPSIDAVAEEKATLVRAVRPSGTVILNADDKRVFAMRQLTEARVFTFGESDAADVRIIRSHVRVRPSEYGNVPEGIEVVFESFNRLRKVYLPGVFGTSATYAISAAFLVAAILDTKREEDEIIPDIVSHFTPLPGRARILPGIKYTILLDGSYNASPISVISALRDLAKMDLTSNQRRVACLGEMRELGPSSEMLHARIGVEAAQLHLDLLVACGTLAHAMKEGAIAGGMREDQIKVFDDAPEAGIFLQGWIRSGDVILIKASEGASGGKGVRMERIVKELMAEPQRAEELLVRQEESWMNK